MLDNKSLWNVALLEIETEVSKTNFSTWFKNTFILKQEDGVVHLSVPNAFARDWLLNKHHNVILRALRQNDDGVKALDYVINRDGRGSGREINKKDEVVFSEQLKLNDLYVNRDDNLNPRYVFDTFVVGPFNELAHAAAQAVVKTPGTVYNPLFIYGGTGLGKTHLIQAVGNQLRQNGGKRVFYTTSEKFTQDYVNSLRNNKPHVFKEKYREYDILIMDDIQFVSGKERTQEELFHLFNSLYENNKQIIFSCDKPPKYIPELEERLRSRFEGGMMIDISRPDTESRVAILKAKAQAMGFNPGDEILQFMASVVQDNIRELEGALNSVVCQIQLKKRGLTIQEVKTLIKNTIKPRKAVSINNVIKTVAGFYNIEEGALYDKTRRKEVVKPRQVVMYLLREDFNTSYPYIGQKMGGRDHTTVIHAYEKIKRDLSTNELLGQELEQIKQLLYNEGVVGG